MQAQGVPLYLPPSKYWLCFYPVMGSVMDLCSWRGSGTTNLAIAQVMSPTGWYYPTTWTAWTDPWAPTSHDGSLRLEGTFPTPPAGVKYLHSTKGLFNLTAPIGTRWHEIYPVFCNTYNLTGWRDNESKGLDYCDFILLRNKHSGEETDWHVEEVAIDIIVTPEPPPVGGEAHPVSKASLLAPWIALGVVLAGGRSWYILRRLRAQS